MDVTVRLDGYLQNGAQSKSGREDVPGVIRELMDETGL